MHGKIADTGILSISSHAVHKFEESSILILDLCLLSILKLELCF